MHNPKHCAKGPDVQETQVSMPEKEEEGGVNSLAAWMEAQLVAGTLSGSIAHWPKGTGGGPCDADTEADRPLAH